MSSHSKAAKRFVADAERMAKKAAVAGDDAAIIIRKALQSALR